MRVRAPVLALLAAGAGLPVAWDAREARAQSSADRSLAEWTYWIAGGAGYRKADSGPTAEDGHIGMVGVGIETTLRAGTVGGERRYGGAYEFRIGPWAQTSVGTAFAVEEGGVILSFTQTSHAQWGTFDLRAGGGYGSVDGEMAGDFVLTASGGVRSFWGRYGNRLDVLRLPGFGSVLRIFGTMRLRPRTTSPWELTAGIEVEPTFLLPPYSWTRLAGARP